MTQSSSVNLTTCGPKRSGTLVRHDGCRRSDGRLSSDLSRPATRRRTLRERWVSLARRSRRCSSSDSRRRRGDRVRHLGAVLGSCGAPFSGVRTEGDRFARSAPSRRPCAGGTDDVCCPRDETWGCVPLDTTRPGTAVVGRAVAAWMQRVCMRMVVRSTCLLGDGCGWSGGLRVGASGGAGQPSQGGDRDGGQEGSGQRDQAQLPQRDRGGGGDLLDDHGRGDGAAGVGGGGLPGCGGIGSRPGWAGGSGRVDTQFRGFGPRRARRTPNCVCTGGVVRP